MSHLNKASGRNQSQIHNEEFLMQTFNGNRDEQDPGHNFVVNEDQQACDTNDRIKTTVVSKKLRRILTCKVSAGILCCSILGGLIISVSTIEGPPDIPKRKFPTDLNTVKITSYEDLQNIKGYPDALEIVSLTSSKPSTPLKKPRDKFKITVETLVVSGQISEEWLHYLLIILRELEKLHLNMDGLCLGSSQRDRSKLPLVYVPNLKHLEMDQSHICSIINWVFFKWELPNLETISLTRIDFNKKSFTLLCEFLEKHKEHIHSVEVSNCKFCEECNLSQIPVEIHKNGKLTFKDNEHVGHN